MPKSMVSAAGKESSSSVSHSVNDAAGVKGSSMQAARTNDVSGGGSAEASWQQALRPVAVAKRRRHGKQALWPAAALTRPQAVSHARRNGV